MLLSGPTWLHPQTSPPPQQRQPLLRYPEVRELSLADPVFRQHQSDLQQFYETIASPRGRVALSFYQYRVGPDDDFLSLAARFSLRPETLATLNGFDTPDALAPGSTVTIPNVQAVFVAAQPRSVLEEVMASWRATRSAEEADGVVQVLPAVVTGAAGRTSFTVYIDELFHPIERAYFYRRLFRFPLADAVLSSRFGRRQSPITGRAHFHGGIDLAAPAGTQVLSAQAGAVVAVRTDALLGLHAVVRHTGGFETLYGHLQTVTIAVGNEVGAGDPLGTVGTSGQTTGPHLHFEVRRHGELIDPAHVLPQDRDG